MESLWNKTVEKPKFNTLNKDIKTDVLIIGGGLTGLLCAYMLQKSGVDYILIEAKDVCGGITANTTAKVTLQHGLIYDKIITKYGADAAKLYYKANLKALERYRKLCGELGCNFEPMDSYVYSLDDLDEIKNEVKACRTIGADADLVTKTELPFDIKAAVRVKDQGQINPLEFLYKISQNLNIFENTKLINFYPDFVQTDKGKIHYKNAIVATHFPLLNKHGFYFMKMYQHRSYVIALKNAERMSGMYVDADKNGMSFRNYGDLLILGGGGHRTGKKGGGWKELENFAAFYFPYSKIVARFATQDCMTLDGLAYIGHYSKNTPNLFVATGFNKWGFTTAMAAAEILCDLVQQKKNRYAELFSPSRSIFHPQLLVNGIESAVNILTPTAPRCPHMGCALKYNSQEHTWDCPCHGSRFTKTGKLIDNPATDDKHL